MNIESGIRITRTMPQPVLTPAWSKQQYGNFSLRRMLSHEEFYTDFYNEYPVGVLGTKTSLASITKNSATHKIDMDTGLYVTTTGGEAQIYTSKSWNPDKIPLVFECSFNNFVAGDGSNRLRGFGFIDPFGETGYIGGNACVAFFADATDTWICYVFDGTNNDTFSISDVVDNDIMKIILTSDEIRFFVNGALVASTTRYIPTISIKAGVDIWNNVLGYTIPMSLSVNGYVYK